MNDKPSVFLKAFGAAGFITCLYGLIIAAFFPGQLWQIPVAFVLCFTAVLLQPLEVALSTRERIYEHRTTVARQKHEARSVGLGGGAGSAGGTVVDNPSKAHIAAWRAWWLAVFVYAAEHGGVVSWKDKDGNGLLKLVKRHEHWLNYFVTPFNGPQYRWLEPCYQGGKTKLREGVTIRFIIGELTRGNVPPTPLDLPPAFKSGEFETVETSEFTDETLVKEL